MSVTIRIDEIRVYRYEDTDADLSHLEQTADDHYGENGSAWAHVSELAKVVVEEEHGSIYAACEEYARQDRERLENYGVTWHSVGIVAEACVSYECGTAGERRLERFKSGGLWGVDSDGGPEYFEQLRQQEFDDLRDHIERFGVDTSNFDELAKGAEWVDGEFVDDSWQYSRIA